MNMTGHAVHSLRVSTLSTKADDIARELEDEIVSGVIAPGAVLRQESRSERFDVSRTPRRQALAASRPRPRLLRADRGVWSARSSPYELREAFLVRGSSRRSRPSSRRRRSSCRPGRAGRDRAAVGELILELRGHARSQSPRDAGLFVEWTRANYAFHDAIDLVADVPLSSASRRACDGRSSATASGARARSSTSRTRRRPAAPGDPADHRRGERDRGAGARPRARPLVQPADRGRPRDARRRPARASWSG